MLFLILVFLFVGRCFAFFSSWWRLSTFFLAFYSFFPSSSVKKAFLFGLCVCAYAWLRTSLSLSVYGFWAVISPLYTWRGFGKVIVHHSMFFLPFSIIAKWGIKSQWLRMTEVRTVQPKERNNVKKRKSVTDCWCYWHLFVCFFSTKRRYHTRECNDKVRDYKCTNR